MILLFDEATSALDTKTEKDILMAVRNLARGRTSMFIAHRLSTAAECDKIMVLDSGRIVEHGTHKELLNKNKVYSDLWLKSIITHEEK